MRNDNAPMGRPVARRSILWWIVPLLLLLLLSLGVLYYLTRQNDDTANNLRTNTGASNNADVQAGNTESQAAITNLATLLSTSDTSSLIGKKVSISSAIVDQVIGDRSFTLGSSTDHVYALLGEQLDAGQTEQAVEVKAGEARSIQGVVVKAPENMTTLIEQFQLSQQQADNLKRQGFYISVNQTSVVNSASGGGDIPTGAGTE